VNASEIPLPDPKLRIGFRNGQQVTPILFLAEGRVENTV
jgi:hypothetical protein